MRRFLIGVFALVVVFLVLYFTLPKFEARVNYTFSKINKHFYIKKVSFEGLKLANEESLMSLLPLDASVVMWLTNEDEVLKNRLKHPLIKDANVSNCSFKSWNCFIVTVVEKDPAALVAIKDSIWAVDDDGVFLSPLNEEQLKNRANLPLIKKVDLTISSPDYIKGRTIYSLKALKILEKYGEKEVETISIKNNGEIIVKFKGMNLTAVFGASGESEFEQLKDEALRFKTLMEHLKGKEVFIRKLDFAFDSQCVVKLTEEGEKILKDFKLPNKNKR